jgi:hypothetical protein
VSHAFGRRVLGRFGTSLTITCDLEVPVALLQVTGWFAVRGSRFAEPQSPQISHSVSTSMRIYGDSEIMQDLLCKSYINILRFWTRSRVDKKCDLEPRTNSSAPRCTISGFHDAISAYANRHEYAKLPDQAAGLRAYAV